MFSGQQYHNKKLDSILWSSPVVVGRIASVPPILVCSHAICKAGNVQIDALTGLPIGHSVHVILAEQWLC